MTRIVIIYYYRVELLSYVAFSSYAKTEKPKPIPRQNGCHRVTSRTAGYIFFLPIFILFFVFKKNKTAKFVGNIILIK